jgi:hypothetical protein
MAAPSWPLAAALLLLPAVTQAALQISPPQLTPDADGMIATEVRSGLASSSRWSVRVIPWEADGGHESAPPDATTIGDVLPHVHPLGVDVSPRFFSLTASGRQVVRARIRDRSRQYRLLIEQIPEDDPESQGVNFRFRFSLPIYRQAGAQPARLRSISIH